jgi:predicted nucleic acid-binding protein
VRLALDTNFLVYAEGMNGDAREKHAEEIVRKLSVDDTFIPVQVLGELFRVLVRKAGRKPKAARESLSGWQDSFSVVETTHSIMLAAVDLSVEHGLEIWDSVILSAAASVGCRLLLSEDFQDGFTWNGVTVANPLAAKKNVLLRALLEERS